MAFEKLCTLDDVWEGEMESFDISDGKSVLLIGMEGGEIKAYQAMCPHQQIELVEGTFEDCVLTCRAHLWQFDCKSGKGINPDDAQLAEYPIKIDGDDVYIDAEGVEPLMSHA